MKAMDLKLKEGDKEKKENSQEIKDEREFCIGQEYLARSLSPLFSRAHGERGNLWDLPISICLEELELNAPNFVMVLRSYRPDFWKLPIHFLLLRRLPQEVIFTPKFVLEQKELACC